MVGISESANGCDLASRGAASEPGVPLPAPSRAGAVFFLALAAAEADGSNMRTFIADSRSSPGGVFEVAAAAAAAAAVDEDDVPEPVSGSETELRSARVRAELTDANGCSSICVKEGRVCGGVAGAGAGPGPGPVPGPDPEGAGAGAKEAEVGAGAAD